MELRLGTGHPRISGGRPGTRRGGPVQGRPPGTPGRAVNFRTGRELQEMKCHFRFSDPGALWPGGPRGQAAFGLGGACPGQ